MKEVKQASVEAEHRKPLPETNWEDVQEPGAYVEEGSGDLYRIPKEALIDGGSPIIVKERRRQAMQETPGAIIRFLRGDR